MKLSPFFFAFFFILP
ncbi:pheA operon leader peptide PheL [Duffyella gerundensis]|nr:pheA operon leader peptide PheL [Duffyella gerundensis]QTO55946.1 pheA operon leader peptide PheL [Duffyella gerundensis]